MSQNSENQSGVVQAPLHRRIAESLSHMVSSGKLRPGDKLPSERQIARQFRASRATVRTALSHLEQSGLINRRERRSAIVSIRRDVTPYLRIACSHPPLRPTRRYRVPGRQAGVAGGERSPIRGALNLVLFAKHILETVGDNCVIDDQ